MIWTPSSIAGRKRTVRVIDVNHNNRIDDASLTKAGIVGVIVKISQGTTFIDSEAARSLAMLKRTNRLRGVYHFTEPGSGEEQARYFWANMLRALGEAWTPDVVIVLDLEPGTHGKMSIEEAEKFCDWIFAKCGARPLLYGGGGLLRDAMEQDTRHINTSLRKCRLFLADPRTNWRMIRGWDEFALRQCAEDHEEPGWDYDEIVCPEGYAGDPAKYLRSEWPRLMSATA